MPRRRGYGDDILISTSVHLAVGTLRTLDELFQNKPGRSSFIREAVEDALKNKMGLKSYIEKLKRDKEQYQRRISMIDEQIIDLEKRQEEIIEVNAEDEQEAIIRKAIENVPTYQKPEDVLADLKPVLKIANQKSEKFVLATIDKIWAEVRGKKGGQP